MKMGDIISINSILFFSARAFLFAVVVGVLYFGLYLFITTQKGQKFDKLSFAKNLAFICYLAALIQITVIRDFGHFLDFSKPDLSFSSVQPVPFKTTIITAMSGTWSFIYNALGNIVWFFPLGVLAPFFKQRFNSLKNILALSAFVSISIEILQWLFTSGISDIDDVIFNVLGAGTGYLVLTMTQKLFIKKRF